jgi:hypothetical protein
MSCARSYRLGSVAFCRLMRPRMSLRVAKPRLSAHRDNRSRIARKYWGPCRRIVETSCTISAPTKIDLMPSAGVSTLPVRASDAPTRAQHDNPVQPDRQLRARGRPHVRERLRCAQVQVGMGESVNSGVQSGDHRRRGRSAVCDRGSRDGASACVVYQPQHCSRDAALDALDHGLAVPLLEIVEPTRDETNCIDCHRGLHLEQLPHGRGHPRQRHRRLDGLCADRVRRFAEHADASKGIARTNQPKHDVAAFGRRLRQLQRAARQDEEHLRLSASAEEQLARLKGFRVPETDDSHERVCRASKSGTCAGRWAISVVSRVAISGDRPHGLVVRCLRPRKDSVGCTTYDCTSGRTPTMIRSA